MDERGNTLVECWHWTVDTRRAGVPVKRHSMAMRRETYEAGWGLTSYRSNLELLLSCFWIFVAKFQHRAIEATELISPFFKLYTPPTLPECIWNLRSTSHTYTHRQTKSMPFIRYTYVKISKYVCFRVTIFSYWKIYRKYALTISQEAADPNGYEC